MEAIRREQEAKARKADREGMLSQVQVLGAGGRQGQESLKEIMETLISRLQEEVRKAHEETARIRRSCARIRWRSSGKRRRQRRRRSPSRGWHQVIRRVISGFLSGHMGHQVLMDPATRGATA